MKQDKIDAALGRVPQGDRAGSPFRKGHNNIGVILAKQGKRDAAIAQFQEALAIDPRFAAAPRQFRRGAVPTGEGRGSHAALGRNGPTYRATRAVNRLAWAMATRPEPSIRNPAEAVELPQWAVQLSRNLDPIPLNTLAAAYARDGQYGKATTTAKGPRVGHSTKDQPLADSIKDKIARYNAHTPYQETADPAPPVHAPAAQGK